MAMNLSHGKQGRRLISSRADPNIHSLSLFEAAAVSSSADQVTSCHLCSPGHLWALGTRGLCRTEEVQDWHGPTGVDSELEVMAHFPR